MADEKQEQQADQKRRQSRQQQAQAPQQQDEAAGQAAGGQEVDDEGRRRDAEGNVVEEVSEAEAGVQREEDEFEEQRAGLATGSQAANPNQPDGSVIQTTTVPLHPEEDTKTENTVLVDREGNEGPAAEALKELRGDRSDG